MHVGAVGRRIGVRRDPAKLAADSWRPLTDLDLPDGRTREWVERQDDLGSPARLRAGVTGGGTASSAEIWRRCA